ncbi:glycine zipper family protein [Chitinolyticbacter meiyuanensis]|uniref:glycine zipper family protein n=1 Tax=Chitinolyticbacter meiyuanensis TaxID=682798 RepID=UPI0011E5CB05|nr:glycine zipper family protein [Chitinolyticbacter meiyuanensis]
MGAVAQTVTTNTKPQSTYDITAHLMPARAFFFVVVDEVGKDGFLVRRIYAAADSPYLAKMNLSPLGNLSELYPERYGLIPKEWNSTTSIAEHVMGNNKSRYVSTSSIFPEGSPRFVGKDIFIDINKAIASGARLVSTDEILKSLADYKVANPHLARRVDQIASYVREIDKEVLIEGRRVPAGAIFTPGSLKTSATLVRAARVVQVVGIAFTAYDLGHATGQSFKAKSVKPITAEVVRQAGGWGAAYAGFKVGGVAGAAVGIETGPGAVITGLVGGIIFGAAGYFGADWVADHIYEN